jgi:hypothetical protein
VRSIHIHGESGLIVPVVGESVVPSALSRRLPPVVSSPSRIVRRGELMDSEESARRISPKRSLAAARIGTICARLSIVILAASTSSRSAWHGKGTRVGSDVTDRNAHHAVCRPARGGSAVIVRLTSLLWLY